MEENLKSLLYHETKNIFQYRGKPYSKTLEYRKNTHMSSVVLIDQLKVQTHTEMLIDVHTLYVYIFYQTYLETIGDLLNKYHYICNKCSRYSLLHTNGSALEC